MKISKEYQNDNATVPFEQIYHAYARYILSYFTCRCPSVQDAEDLTQEVFLKVFLHLEQLQDTMNLSGWLRQIAHNTYVSSCRRQRVQTVPYAEYLAPDTRQQSRTDEALALIEWWEVCRCVVGAYSMDYWIVLWSVSGYNSNEIAVMLGISSQSVRHRLIRLRKRMQAAVPNR